VSQSRLLQSERLLFAISTVELRYLKPARFEDELTVTVELDRLRRASMAFRQEIRRGGAGGELLCTAQVTAACLDADTMRPRPLPANLFPE
jgi:acyl-CoA thioester hydrolase